MSFVRRVTLVLAAVLLAVLPALAGAQDVPRERAEKLLETFRQLKPGKNLPAAEKAANEKLIAQLDAAFDFEGITTAILSPRAEKLTPAQRAEFKAKFHELIRAGTFVGTSAFFKKATLTFRPSVMAAGEATVTIHVAVPSEDNEVDVGLAWRDVGGASRVVDVLLDGESLVKDYQNQVARIVDRDGVAELFAKLAERRAQIERAEVK